VHGFCCYDNIVPNVKCLVLCLVAFIDSRVVNDVKSESQVGKTTYNAVQGKLRPISMWSGGGMCFIKCWLVYICIFVTAEMLLAEIFLQKNVDSSS